MGEENIRKRVVTSFRKAIDYEQQENDVEAYRTYLEGLALVAAALQQDAENSWTLGNPSFTGKERRSLIGFAKQSIDRIVHLLDKQDQESSNVIKETTEIVDNERKKRSFRDLSYNVPNPQNVHMGTSPENGCLSGEAGCAAVFSVCNDESPLVLMQHENKRLVARYTARMQNATSAVQRQNLQLELERRLVENAVIARQHQEQWEQRRTESVARCNKISEMIKENPGERPYTDNLPWGLFSVEQTLPPHHRGGI